MPLGKAANPRRNPLEFDESDELVGAEGSDHALTSMGSCVPPVETASPGRNLQRRAEETRRGGSSESCRGTETSPETLTLTLNLTLVDPALTRRDRE